MRIENELRKYAVIDGIRVKEFDEDKHPRDSHGRFGSGGQDELDQQGRAGGTGPSMDVVDGHFVPQGAGDHPTLPGYHFDQELSGRSMAGFSNMHGEQAYVPRRDLPEGHPARSAEDAAAAERAGRIQQRDALPMHQNAEEIGIDGRDLVDELRDHAGTSMDNLHTVASANIAQGVAKIEGASSLFKVNTEVAQGMAAGEVRDALPDLKAGADQLQEQADKTANYPHSDENRMDQEWANAARDLHERASAMLGGA